jgi:putative inorganic carbon (HCO3(-)) transporter
MRDLALTLFIFGVLPYVFVRPHVGILLWSWLGYMNPHRLTYGFAFTMPFTQITAICTILAMIFTKDRQPFPFRGITIVWIIFVLWTFFTYMFALNPYGAAIEFNRWYKIAIMIICTFLLINNKEKLIQLVWVIAISIGFFGIKGGIFAIRTGFRYRISGPKDSFIGGNNEMALALLMVIPLMYFLFTVSEKKFIKLGLLGAILLSFFAVISSYSRGAFLGMSVMLFFLWLGTKHKLVTMGIVVAIIVAGIPFIPQKWFERMDTIETYQQDESAMSRINSWKFAFNLANDRPIIGGGYRTFTRQAFAKYAPNPDVVFDAHSIYFEMLGEQGYVGLILFLTIWALVFLEARKIKKLSKGNEELRWVVTLVTMIQVGLIAYMTSGAFLGMSYFDLPYHYMSIVVIAGLITRKVIQEETENGASRVLSYAR